jgi:hypothetical protein
LSQWAPKLSKQSWLRFCMIKNWLLDTSYRTCAPLGEQFVYTYKIY